MGSRFTCMWALLTFAVIEILILLPQFNNNIIVFK